MAIDTPALLPQMAAQHAPIDDLPCLRPSKIGNRSTPHPWDFLPGGNALRTAIENAKENLRAKSGTKNGNMTVNTLNVDSLSKRSAIDFTDQPSRHTATQDVNESTLLCRFDFIVETQLAFVE